MRRACATRRCEPLVISMFGDEDNVLASIEAGALGYIHKDAAPDDIAQTILEMKARGLADLAHDCAPGAVQVPSFCSQISHWPAQNKRQIAIKNEANAS